MDEASLRKMHRPPVDSVDLIEFSKESAGWSTCQVLQLRLEHHLLQRRLAKTEEKLKEMEVKVARRNEEIEFLKAQIRILLGSDSGGGGGGLQIPQEEDEEQMTSTLGNEEESSERPSSIPGTEGALEEESAIGEEDKSEVGEGSEAAMEDVVQSELGDEEEDLQRPRPDLVIGEGMRNIWELEVPFDSVDLEMEDGRSSSSSDSVLISEGQKGSKVNEGESMDGTPSQPKAPAPGIPPRRMLSTHSGHSCRSDGPSSILAHHSDSDMEVSSGEDERTAPNSGGPTVAVVKTGNRFGCLHCPEKFTRKDNLIKHRFRKHRNVTGLFICDSCQKAFLSEEDLKLHLIRCHRLESERKTFKCKYCPKWFLSKAHRWEHQNTHDKTTGEVKRLQCHFCPGKSFGTYQTLKNHQKTIHAQRN